ncbi:MAG: hypothetical protein AAB131_14545 [Actinomycetota bacterium]|mgnify:CR=1 FL=1
MTDKKRISETAALRQAEQIVARSMPSGWSAKVVQARGRSTGPRALALRIRPAADDGTDFSIITKRTLNPMEAGHLLHDLGIGTTNSLRGPKPASIAIVAPYLSERTREVIAAHGVSYIDSTGNMRLQSDKPALYVLTNGADKDPWFDHQPLKSLRGRGAGRALRAIVDFAPPYGVRELASRAKVSPATLARVIELLARDALLTRDVRGRVHDVDWAGCLRRWSKDYEFASSNQTTTFLAPGEVGDITSKLATVKWRYALTGSLAAQSFSQIAPARVGMLYVDDVETALRVLELREVDSEANVLIAEPFDPVVYERTIKRDRLTLAAPTQIVVDLLTGIGRMPSEGEELLAWMKDNERVWRS